MQSIWHNGIKKVWGCYLKTQSCDTPKIGHSLVCTGGGRKSQVFRGQASPGRTLEILHGHLHLKSTPNAPGAGRYALQSYLNSKWRQDQPETGTTQWDARLLVYSRGYVQPFVSGTVIFMLQCVVFTLVLDGADRYQTRTASLGFGTDYSTRYPNFFSALGRKPGQGTGAQTSYHSRRIEYK